MLPFLESIRGSRLCPGGRDFVDTRRLEIFLKLLDTRSFSKTAKALGLTQPSVSASLKSLEESLGQRLFERTPRAVRPLPAALTLAPYANSIVETMGRAAWAVGHQLANVREKLAIGASSVPSMVFVPPAMAEFSRQYPNVFVKLRTGDSKNIIARVQDGEFDLGVVGAAPEDESLSAVAFGRDKLVMVASEPLAASIGEPPKAVEDLLKWPLIVREDGSGTRSVFLGALGDNAGALVSRMDLRAEVEGPGPALMLVRAGIGAAIISGHMTGVMNLEGMVVMDLDFVPSVRKFYIVRRKTAQALPAVDAMVQLLKNSAKQQ
ncbi:hypothetical protein C4J81_14940 [Deltaproteobacteria bacterium Smac51]|nr:hypothetical protein C4J81_14940 [Deltaproteobacteria bacterium Smac51]